MKNKIIKLPAIDDVVIEPTTEQYQEQNEVSEWGSVRITRKGGIQETVVEVFDDYTALENDRTIIMNQVTGAKQVTLPTPTTGNGKIYTVKMMGTDNVTVQGNGVNIDGTGSYALTVQYSTVTVQFFNNLWYIIATS